MATNNYLQVEGLRFSVPHDEVKSVASRTACPMCGERRRYYCYDCVVPIGHSPPVPAVNLPLTFHIVRHASEKPSKSSVIPLKLIYPDKVFLYTFKQPNRFDPEAGEGTIFPCFPTDIDWDRAAVLFPGKGAKTVAELRSDGGEQGESVPFSTSPLFEHIIVIDATWTTAQQVINKHPKIRTVATQIKLGEGNQTVFWRHQNIDRSCLATCEAVYVLLREMHATTPPYNHQFDDVLFYYVFVHGLISEFYTRTKKHRGHLPDYTIREEVHRLD